MLQRVSAERRNMLQTGTLSAHPVDEAVRERVLKALGEIEEKHDVRVLFACESGSRGWGFASPDSDYDVRFVYVHRLPWYLTVGEQRDVIELPISDALDVSGWELRKALQLLAKSNPTLLEWLDSPVVYRQDAAWVARLRSLCGGFFSGMCVRHHYVAMARKNFRGYLQGESVRLKKYLYVLRPLLAAQWVDEGRGMPPMRFAELVDGLVNDMALHEEINALLAIKMQAGEAGYSPRWSRIHAFIVERLAQADAEIEHPRPWGCLVELDRLLMQTVAT
jgi:predicted nucleotidyltransferase